MYVCMGPHDVILSGANVALGGFVNPALFLLSRSGINIHFGVESTIFRRTSPDFHERGKPPWKGENGSEGGKEEKQPFFSGKWQPKLYRSSSSASHGHLHLSLTLHVPL